MGILDDTELFIAIIQQGGFSHAAKHLGLSNGLISRRIAQLEKQLGVTLIKRTTRQIQLTKEGELFWQHASRIQEELDFALDAIHASAKKPKGLIRISAPPYFGRHYLTPILNQFFEKFPDIQVNLLLSNEKVNLIKEKIDLSIRGAGYLQANSLQDSNLRMKKLVSEKIGLYASPVYLKNHANISMPNDLAKHFILSSADHAKLVSEINWQYSKNSVQKNISLQPIFSCNDIESTLIACINGQGIAKFTQLNVKHAVQRKLLCPILTQYDWGDYHLYALYPTQNTLPKRTRLLLDFIQASLAKK